MGIDKKAHGSGGFDDGVIDFRGSKFEAGLDVFRLKIGKIGENLGFGYAGGEHLENVLDTDAHVPDARTSATLLRVKGDAVEILHG